MGAMDPAPATKAEDYRSLQPEKIVQTASLLVNRITERFPESSLLRLARQVLEVSRETKELSALIGAPRLSFRIPAAVAVVAGFLLAGDLLLHTRIRLRPESLSEFTQGLDALLNLTIILSAAVFFFVTLDERIARRKTLRALHRLRSMAHIVDMHQLTKDPERVTGRTAADTKSSPERYLTPFQLTRYLDYCSEMLAIIGKVAALYAKDSSDQVVLSAVNEVEGLTSGLSFKIWQKIMIVLSTK